jgi:hypothetical protein
MQQNGLDGSALVAAIKTKRARLDTLVARFFLMADVLELYEYVNHRDCVEHGMIMTAHKLYERNPWHSYPAVTEYAASRAAWVLASVSRDGVEMPYDSLARCRDALATGDLPPVGSNRKAYPREAGEDVLFAYSDQMQADMLHYIDTRVDLTGYRWGEAARCLVDAALQRGSLWFADGRVLFALTQPGPNGQWRSNVPPGDLGAAFATWSWAWRGRDARRHALLPF